MMEGLTACFTLTCFTLEGSRADLVTSLEGGPMEALATTEVEMVGKSQVEEQGHASSNFKELDAFRLTASGMKIVQQMKSVHFRGNMVLAWKFSQH